MYLNLAKLSALDISSQQLKLA